jgi:hypothetical protein
MNPKLMIFCIKTVNFSELTVGFMGKAQLSSHYETSMALFAQQYGLNKRLGLSHSAHAAETTDNFRMQFGPVPVPDRVISVL